MFNTQVNNSNTTLHSG